MAKDIPKSSGWGGLAKFGYKPETLHTFGYKQNIGREAAWRKTGYDLPEIAVCERLVA